MEVNFTPILHPRIIDQLGLHVRRLVVFFVRIYEYRVYKNKGIREQIMMNKTVLNNNGYDTTTIAHTTLFLFQVLTG